MVHQTRSSESGQILILVMLVLLVGLTVGLSLAARSISNIQNSGDLDQSNRAFSAAEAGVEHVLNPSQTDCPVGSSCTISVNSSTTANVKVSSVGGTNGVGYYISNEGQDDVAQLTLSGYTGSPTLPTSVDIYWDGSGGTPSHPAIVVSVLNNNSGTYSLQKSAYDDNAGSHLNSFTPITCTYSGPAIFAQDGQAYTLPCKQTISVIAGQTVLVRVRLMYTSGSILFAPQGATSGSGMPIGSYHLPSQGKYITSTANVNGKQRTVTAFQSNPQLPAIFDYAIFNGSTSQLSK